MESGIQLKESAVLLKIVMQNPRSTDKDWNPVPENPESTAWNPESKTVLNSLTWGKNYTEDLYVLNCSYPKRNLECEAL